MIKYILLTLILSVCIFPSLVPREPKFVSFLIVLEEGRDGAYGELLIPWLQHLDFHDFTFAVCRDELTSGYWLLNQTRLNILKSYGVVIPQTFLMQVYPLEERRRIIDDLFNLWVTVVGYAPKGIFDFMPDTYTMNYCRSKGFEYVTSYCFDQYAIDWMTMRGGWQLPYYASSNHVLVPDNSSGGMVVFSHQIWDWVSSLTVSHNLHTHPLSLIQSVFNGNESLAKNYFLKLIDASLEGSEPLGVASIQFEWNWHCNNNLQDYLADWIQTLLSTRNYTYWTLEDINTWFRNEYSSTPTYTVNFTSPYDNESVEWFYSQNKRVARVNTEVVSYVNYENQSPDKFLNTTFLPNFYDSPHNASNCVDISLNFTLDGLGGGEYRAPVRDNGTVYNETLGNYPNITLPVGGEVDPPKPDEPPVIPELSLPMILTLMVSTGIIYFVQKIVRRKRNECSF